jgi:hypothetical protein
MYFRALKYGSLYGTECDFGVNSVKIKDELSLDEYRVPFEDLEVSFDSGVTWNKYREIEEIVRKK